MKAITLEDLKQKLLHEKELAVVWTFFLDHFGDHENFIALGMRTESSVVEEALAQIGHRLYGKAGIIKDLLLTRVPGQQFLHGGFTTAGRVGAVIYFEDAEIGLAVVAEIAPSPGAKFARFSPQPIPKGAGPSMN
jgi:hypothetical protein